MSFAKHLLWGSILAGWLGIASAQALEFKVVGVQNQIVFQTTLAVDPLASPSVGSVSDQVLSEALSAGSISEYRGSVAGVASIANLGSVLEVVSNTEMHAYGWCYRVDGVESGLLADQFELDGTESRIEWFYGYARYERDRWTAMCVPADHIPVEDL